MDVDQPFGDLLDAELHVCVGRHGSVRLAATACGISQPAASRRLHMMERRAGTRLYEFSTKGAKLSAAGMFWQSEGQRLLADLRDAAVRFDRDFLTTGSRLRIIAGQVVAEHLLPSWLLEWAEGGDRHCHVEIGNYTSVQDAVLKGEAELGLLELSGEVPEQFRAVPLVGDRLVLVVSPAHPLAARRSPLTLDELARMPLIQRESESGTLLALTRMLRAGGHRLAQPAIEVGSASAVKSAATRGLAPAVVPRISVTEEIESGRLCEMPVAGMELRLTVYAIHRRSVRLTSAADSFLASAVRSAAASPARRPGRRAAAPPPRGAAVPGHRGKVPPVSVHRDTNQSTSPVAGS
ncbi:LysR family transcriptional regulator [Streptomyces sp. NPDC004838]